MKLNENIFSKIIQSIVIHEREIYYIDFFKKPSFTRINIYTTRL